jgi:hypothetical protein
VCEFLLWWLNAGFQDTLKVEGVGFGFGIVVDEVLPRWRASGGVKELGKGSCGW